MKLSSLLGARLCYILLVRNQRAAVPPRADKDKISACILCLKQTTILLCRVGKKERKKAKESTIWFRIEYAKAGSVCLHNAYTLLCFLIIIKNIENSYFMPQAIPTCRWHASAFSAAPPTPSARFEHTKGIKLAGFFLLPRTELSLSLYVSAQFVTN